MAFFHASFSSSLFLEHSLKPGKVVIMTSGKFAGKKAVILRSFEKGTKARPYAHAVIAGIERYPRRIYSSMTKKEINRHLKMKTFLKVVNFQHFMPTRFVPLAAHTALGVCGARWRRIPDDY